MKNIRIGGEDDWLFDEKDRVDCDDIPKRPCILCESLSKESGELVCKDSGKVCPFVKEMQDGVWVNCLKF